MKLIPKYAILPLALCLGLNCLVYFGSKLLIGGRIHYDFSIWLDHEIPFVPQMIIVYVLAYVLWIVGYVVIARESKEVCYRICTGEIIAKLICLFFFIAVPTTLVRPVIENGGDLCTQLTAFIYKCDSPENLFPSIHCLESWVCFRGAMYCKKMGKLYKVIIFICAMLVFMSTVMVKQHVVVDMAGAVIAAEIGFYISKRIFRKRIW